MATREDPSGRYFAVLRVRQSHRGVMFGSMHLTETGHLIAHRTSHPLPRPAALHTKGFRWE